MKRAATLIALALALSACGQRADLQPAAGDAMPVAPVGSAASPTAEELLQAPTQARPDRSDEVITRSRDRAADPFDLPPTD